MLLGVVWSIEHFKYYLYGKPFTVITDHRALLFKTSENRAFSGNDLTGSKMGLVDYISRKPQQKAVNISTSEEQFIVAKLDAIKHSAKRFLLITEKYTDFTARKSLIKSDANSLNSSDNLCSEFAPRNCEYSEITNNDSIISELTPN